MRGTRFRCVPWHRGDAGVGGRAPGHRKRRGSTPRQRSGSPPRESPLRRFPPRGVPVLRYFRRLRGLPRFGHHTICARVGAIQTPAKLKIQAHLSSRAYKDGWVYSGSSSPPDHKRCPGEGHKKCPQSQGELRIRLSRERIFLLGGCHTTRGALSQNRTATVSQVFLRR